MEQETIVSDSFVYFAAHGRYLSFQHQKNVSIIENSR